MKTNERIIVFSATKKKVDRLCLDESTWCKIYYNIERQMVLSIACKQAIHLWIAKSEGSHTSFKGSEVQGYPLHVTYDSPPRDFPVKS